MAIDVDPATMSQDPTNPPIPMDPTNPNPGRGGLPIGWLGKLGGIFSGLGGMFGGGGNQASQNQIDYQGGMSQNLLDNLRNQNIQPQNQTLWNNYLTANDLGRQQQSGLMDAYGGAAQNAMNLFNPAYQGFSGMAFGTAGGFDPQFRGGLSSALGGYQNFADTGGLSPQNLSDMRARSVAPLRAVYAGVNRDIDRQRALTGGYSPNYAAVKAKTARDLAAGLSDASTNVEAGLAEQIRSGKLAGLGGLTQTSATGQGLQNAIDSLNSQSRLAGLTGMGQMAGGGMNAYLNALGGASDVYRSAPGLANMTGNQMLTSSGQLVDVGQLQNQLGLGIMNAQNQRPQRSGSMLGGFGGILGGLFPGGLSSGGGGGGGIAGLPGRTGGSF